MIEDVIIGLLSIRQTLCRVIKSQKQKLKKLHKNRKTTNNQEMVEAYANDIVYLGRQMLIISKQIRTINIAIEYLQDIADGEAE